MIAIVFADTLQLVHHLDTVGAQQLRLTDTGQLQHLRRLHGAGADNNLAVGTLFLGDTIDFITPGTDGFDNATPSGINAKFRLTQVPEGTTLQAIPRNNAVLLSWGNVADGPTFTIEGYNIIQTSPLPGGVVNEAPVTGTRQTTVGLTAGVEYCYVVQPIASNGRRGALSNEVCAVPSQDMRTVWDARVDWADALDQAVSPNAPWTYRSAEAPPVGNTYGDLLVWNLDGQGSSPAYTLCLNCSLRPIFAGTVQFGGFDELEEQVGGHGAYMLRWTSPISGIVQVEGYIYQSETPLRLTNWKILKNDFVFTEGFTGFDEFGPLNGFDNRVFLDGGSGGLRRTYISVAPGDNVDIVTPGFDMFGETIGAGCNMRYSIRIADPTEVPTLPYWDAREDFLGGFDQTRSTNEPWSYRSAEPNAYGEPLVWNPAGQFGSSPAYTACLDCGVRPVLAGSVQFGGQDAQLEQIGGHGAFMVRWTSPIDGTIDVEGYIYQTDTSDRLTHWQFLKNDVVFWEGFTAHDELGPLNGFENRVFLEDGGPPAGGAGGLSVQVSVGDTIDFITPGDPMFGSDIPAGLNVRLRYTPDETGMGTPFRRGDHDGSGIVDITDPLNFLGFLFLGTTPPICEDASDGDNSGALDISDALNVLGFLFLGSFPLNETLPGPTNCGLDPTVVIDPDGAGGFPVQPATSLGCESYPSSTGTACP